MLSTLLMEPSPSKYSWMEIPEDAYFAMACSSMNHWNLGLGFPDAVHRRLTPGPGCKVLSLNILTSNGETSEMVKA